MNIAVLSGKGGTGKTLVSVNLAFAADNASYVDCDVEEPNGHLFLKPEIKKSLPVAVMIPEADSGRCTECRKCIDFCKYNALALVKGKIMIFSELCHSCGGCVLLCPRQVFTEKERVVGTVEEGVAGEVKVFTGCMNTGEISGVPIIKELMEKLPKQGTVVIDCPPGSACVVMESIQKADFCVLVAEPTLFGVHNLAMVYDLVRLFKKPSGAVLNKCMPGRNPAEEYCAQNNIRILAKIPFDSELGLLNSNGLIAANENGTYLQLFMELLTAIEKEAVS